MVPEPPPAPDRDELLRLLGVRARDGHVVAIRMLLEETRDDDQADDPFAVFDPPTSIIDTLRRRRLERLSDLPETDACRPQGEPA